MRVKKTYPEPVEHCNVCRWFRECDQRRRADDHLSLVAGIRRQQQESIRGVGCGNDGAASGAAHALERKAEARFEGGVREVQKQARIQVEGRTENRPKHELLLPVAEGSGFCRLPEPSADDMFVGFGGRSVCGGTGAAIFVLDLPFGIPAGSGATTRSGL